MAKGQGRPKRNTGVHNQDNVSKKENEQVNPAINKVVDLKVSEDATHNQDETAQTEAPSEKVLEVSTDPKKKAQRQRPSELRKITHTVIVNGTTREMSKQAFEAISKSPQIKIVLPKGSLLVEPSIQPCIDC